MIAITMEGGSRLRVKPCYYFRLQREFDRSGTINLGGQVNPPLKPDTSYEIRVGTLLLDDPIDDDQLLDLKQLEDKLPPAKAWLKDLFALPEEQSKAEFRTFPTSGVGDDQLDFLLGSCRYPGLLWKFRHSDRIFAPMAESLADADDGSRPRFVLMVGDQIYADLFNLLPIGRADTYNEFRDRYITAFRSHNIRRLMQRLPTYMVLDDHEIEDNWTQDRIRRCAKYQLFTIAIDAYLSYQWSHGPRSYGKRLYYRFDCGRYPFFVLDTRTQRYLEGDEGDLSDNHLLGRPTLPGSQPGQLQRLLTWLQTQQRCRGDVPKFIVCSSVFVPNPMSARNDRSDRAKERSDSWPGFPNTRAAILRCIVDNCVQNVVFLSGDIHCSNVASLSFKGSEEAEKLRAFSVTSSAFYWPFPFADGEPSDYVHDSTEAGQSDTFTFESSAGQTLTMDYEAGNFTQEDKLLPSLDRPGKT
ncbi:MAG: alkaline phosphatase D family protein [Deltaproteobacteria bacterium]|nr:alkaline phosphatase D family protein [Deltaproteobacteria bacterium]